MAGTGVPGIALAMLLAVLGVMLIGYVLARVIGGDPTNRHRPLRQPIGRRTALLLGGLAC